MNVLQILKSLALNVGIPQPATIISTNRQVLELVEFANEAAEEMARRVDWGGLRATATLTGDGTDKLHALPAAFSRLAANGAVRFSGSVLRPLTRAEWNTMTPTAGTPRYFLLEGQTMRLWPYLANAATATVLYQSVNFITSGAAFIADTDDPKVPNDVLLKGIVARWRRQKGMAYQDEEAEYEAALAQAASFDDGARF